MTMNDITIFLTPVFAFCIVALLGFVGCGVTLPPAAEDKPVEQKPSESPPAPPPTSPVSPPAPLTYAEVISATPGFAALWPLNETAGNVASVAGPLAPDANGVYKTAAGVPAGSGYTLGNEGVLFAKDSKDFAPEFTGGAAFIEVPFNAQLNPSPGGMGFSIELWVKPDPNSGADRQILVSSHNFESGSKEQGYEIGLLKVAGQPHEQVYGRVFSGTGPIRTEIAVQPVDGDPAEWRHIVFTYKPDTAGAGSIHLRVQLAKATGFYSENPAAATYENVTPAKPSTLRFASSHVPPGGGLSLLAGRIDNVAIYTAPLSDADIKKHFDMV